MSASAPEDHSTSVNKKQDVEKNASALSDDNDENVVDWEDSDSRKECNPMEWPGKEKVFNVSLVIVLTLITPLASSMFAPGVPRVLMDFREGSKTLAELVVSVYILGFAVGPLLISPLSEMYGRSPVYITCNIMFVIFTVACAVAQNITQLTVFRFFAGCFGVCPVTLGGATISDLIVQEKRGISMSLFALCTLLGPSIGPISGGYLTAGPGWRWIFWVIAIAYGICTILHFFFCRETYAPVILERKTKRLREETGNDNLRSKLDDNLPKKVRLQRALIRPIKLLVTSPIVFLLSLWMAIVYGILYMLYTTIAFVFQGPSYHFSEGNTGLTYIPSGIGMIIGLMIIGATSDRQLQSKASKHDGELKPEYRLIASMWLGWLVPVGMFVYGWTAEKQVHWAVPLLGTLLFGIGIISAMINVSQYLIDAFTRYAASAVAAATLLRSLVGGLLPLGGLDLYSALGLGWGNSLMGFIALALVPIPYLFYIHGERLRKRFPPNV